VQLGIHYLNLSNVISSSIVPMEPETNEEEENEVISTSSQRSF